MSDDLPALPDAEVEVGDLVLESRTYVQAIGWGNRDPLYTSEQMRAYAAAAVAAERERLKADAAQWGGALNDAGWEAIFAYRRITDQIEPPAFFNHAKGIFRDALAVYFKKLGA